MARKKYCQEPLSRASEALGLDHLRMAIEHRPDGGSAQHRTAWLLCVFEVGPSWTVISTPYCGSNLEQPCPGRRFMSLSSHLSFLFDQTEKTKNSSRWCETVWISTFVLTFTPTWPRIAHMKRCFQTDLVSTC